jgi:hypothetical protein
MVQDKDADRRREARVTRARIVDFSGKAVERRGFFGRDSAEGIPEFGLQ